MDTEKFIIVDFANYGGGNAPKADTPAREKMLKDIAKIRTYNKGRKNKISVAEYRSDSTLRTKVNNAAKKKAPKTAAHGNATTETQKQTVGRNAARGRAKAAADKPKSARKSARKTARKSARKTARKTARKSARKTARKSK